MDSDPRTPGRDRGSPEDTGPKRDTLRVTRTTSVYTLELDTGWGPDWSPQRTGGLLFHRS